MPEGVRSHSSAAFVKPQTELEQLLVNVWQEMLNIDKVGIHDNFFELGGHSLLAVQIHNKLQELLGLEVSVVEVFQYPTVHSLAKYIREKQEGKPEAESAPARGEKRGARRASMKERRQARQQHRTKRK
jgi:acyl carrier protein